MTVNHPTLYPSGELDSTGAPTASWYDGPDSFPPFARTYARPPSRRTETSDSEVLAAGASTGWVGFTPIRDRMDENTIFTSWRYTFDNCRGAIEAENRAAVDRG